MKRFYKEVSTGAVAHGWQVTLDGRAIRTVGGAPQIVPSQALAQALANEWRAQGETIDPALFRLRDHVDYAIDVVAADPAGAAHKLFHYGDTDTLLYRADPDEPLYAHQIALWEPVVAAFEAREGVKLVRVSGIIHRAQDPAAMAQLTARLAALDPFALTAAEAMTTLAASLVVGLGALETDDPDAARALWDAACLEEQWQADMWGRDDEAEERRTRRTADFLAAHSLALLARS